jgi:hypothetical protein
MIMDLILLSSLREVIFYKNVKGHWKSHKETIKMKRMSSQSVYILKVKRIARKKTLKRKLSQKLLQKALISINLNMLNRSKENRKTIKRNITQIKTHYKQ